MSHLSSLAFGNGVTDYLQRDNTYLDVAQDWTVSWWMRQDPSVPVANFRTYWTFGDPAFNDAYIFVGSFGNATNLFIEAWDGTNDNLSNVVTPITSGVTWLYAQLVYTASTHELKLSLESNGVCIMTVDLSAFTFPEKKETVGPLYSSSTYVSRLRVWQAKLTDIELQYERRNHLAYRTANLLSDNPLSTIYYPSSGETAPVLRDESGNGRTLTLTGTSLIAASPFSEAETLINHIVVFDRDETVDGAYFLAAGGHGINGVYSSFVPFADTGIIPPQDGLAVFDYAISDLVITDPTPQSYYTTGPGIPPDDGTFIKLNGVTGFAISFNGGSIFVPAGVGGNGLDGGTNSAGVTGWGTISPPSALGTNGAHSTLADYIEFTTLRQWRRDMLFLRSYAQFAMWWNSNFIYPAYALYLHSVKCEVHVRLATLTAPAYTVPPIVVAPGTRGNILVRKIAVSSSQSESFSFTTVGLTPATFILTPGDQQLFEDVIPGSGYGVTEAPNPNWSVSYTSSNASSHTNLVVTTNTTTTLYVTNTFIGPRSGIYFIHPQKTNDTLFDTITDNGTETPPTYSTVVVPIPNPFIVC